jgi:DNA invertase Pin-like site-specific DNA recombinase
MPDGNTLTIGIFALLTQHERELISSRTKAALQQKKIQGFTLGKPENLTERVRLKGLQIRQENVCSHNSHGFTTRRGKQFFPITVQRLYQGHKHLPVKPLYHKCIKQPECLPAAGLIAGRGKPAKEKEKLVTG